MALPPLIGHAGLRARLAQAVAKGTLPQVILLTGPAGVGKQRLALWLAQLVLCERRGNEPCGECRACRLAESLSHPDLHWFVPIPRPKVSDPEKQVELLSKAHAIVVDEAAWLFVVHDLNPRAMSKKVKGFSPAQSWSQDFTTISMD